MFFCFYVFISNGTNSKHSHHLHHPSAMKLAFAKGKKNGRTWPEDFNDNPHHFCSMPSATQT